MIKTTYNELAADDRMLVDCARKATGLSYSPYSRFRVGAAALLANGQVVMGANQENASYPVGICAERSTLATAQNLYPGVAVVALALAAATDNEEVRVEPVTPCGMCRQALLETETRYASPIRILMSGKEQVIVAESAKVLLPAAFV